MSTTLKRNPLTNWHLIAQLVASYGVNNEVNCQFMSIQSWQQLPILYVCKNVDWTTSMSWYPDITVRRLSWRSDLLVVLWLGGYKGGGVGAEIHSFQTSNSSSSCSWCCAMITRVFCHWSTLRHVYSRVHESRYYTCSRVLLNKRVWQRFNDKIPLWLSGC